MGSARMPLERIRRLALAYSGATERLSHEKSAFFVESGAMFAMFDGDRPVAILRLAAPPGAQDALVAAEPDRYIRPPYLAYRGWIGIVIDGRTDCSALAAHVAEAHAAATNSATYRGR